MKRLKMSKSILERGQVVANSYTVQFFLKKGSYAESYRVQNNAKEIKFLKLFDLAKLHRTQYTKDGDVLEIEILKKLNHPNIVKYNDSGSLILNNQKYAYVVLDFISGETMADKMARDEYLNIYEAKNVILDILNGVEYLHQNNIIHNELTNLNIMLDLSGKIPSPKIIDFGYARYLTQTNKDFLKEGLYPFYQANEVFNGVFSIQSDIFSVGALYYHILEGLPPYFFDISQYGSNKIDIEDAIINERNRRLPFVAISDTNTQSIILKALNSNPNNRFKNVNEFISAVNGELQVQTLQSEFERDFTIKVKREGEGFSAIAGMKELKKIIQLDVIDAILEKERYAEYGLTIPNGVLLYGPPGCGKTFFAEKLAEEIGFNFIEIKPSDIQSKWVNASQENIKNLFDEARKDAPSIIFIDELDALVPNRDASGISHMNTSAVNEFLAQMNNCGEDDVFVIGATNRPNAIDTAILRSGRLDKHIYIPPPDFEARKEMFKLYLEKRPTEIGIDYIKLAENTKNYVSSDIKFLCDEAARSALTQDKRITNDILLSTIKKNKPSLSKNELDSYIDIKDKLQGNNNRPVIGFKK